ncbi:hypothetical protein M3Y96_00573900 [Aphelenchoides besseyi]|nr:hypothetical protein M3Y96_00573900 [Aphelenchoides besseyi]
MYKYKHAKQPRREDTRPAYNSESRFRRSNNRSLSNFDDSYESSERYDNKDRCSMYKVKIKPNSVVYRYDVQITDNQFELTRPTDIGLQIANKMCCYEIVRIVLVDYPDSYVYDGANTLYMKEEIEDIETTLLPNRLTPESQICVRRRPVQVTIQANKANPSVCYSDFTPALRSEENRGIIDRSPVNFIELLTTQAMLRTNRYQVSGPGLLFETQARFRQPGFETVEGVYKGARAINKSSLCLVFDVQRSLFYQSQIRGRLVTLAELLEQTFEGNRRKFEEHYYNVRMQLTYVDARVIKFERFTDRAISSQDYDIEGGQSVPDYFMETYQHEINENLRGCRARNNEHAVFPLDGLRVFPNQLVPQQKVPESLLAPIPPQQRYDLITYHVQRLVTGEGADFLEKFGVTVLPKSNIVEITNSSIPPTIRINSRDGEQTIQPRENGDYFNALLRARVLIKNRDIKRWIVGYGRGLQARQIEEYIKNLAIACAESGMNRLPEPRYEYVEVDKMERLFRHSEEHYIFYIDHENERGSHSRLKLFESLYKILTQHVVRKNLNARNQTMKNVVFKLNSKCFGLNFAPVFDSSIEMLDLEKNDDLLVIGLDVAHPTRSSSTRKEKTKGKDKDKKKDKDDEPEKNKYPSVVGICSNKTSVRYAFTPDFFYQETNQEQISGPRLVKAVKKIVQIAHEKKKVIPHRLFIFRDGVGEGQYSMVLNNELEAIRQGYEEAVESIDSEFDVKKLKLNLVIATKRHHKRFFSSVGRDQYQNTRVGDFIAGEFTREDLLAEFFLQTHNPIRLTQYSLLKNDMDLTPAQLRTFIICLSNMHQISGCPTSLPIPIYVADESAARGLMIFNELRMMDEQAIWPEFMREHNYDSDILVDFDRLTELLSYSEHRLGGTRFNS